MALEVMDNGKSSCLLCCCPGFDPSSMKMFFLARNKVVYRREKLSSEPAILKLSSLRIEQSVVKIN